MFHFPIQSFCIPPITVFTLHLSIAEASPLLSLSSLLFPRPYSTTLCQDPYLIMSQRPPPFPNLGNLASELSFPATVLTSDHQIKVSNTKSAYFSGQSWNLKRRFLRSMQRKTLPQPEYFHVRSAHESSTVPKPWEATKTLTRRREMRQGRREEHLNMHHLPPPAFPVVFSPSHRLGLLHPSMYITAHSADLHCRHAHQFSDRFGSSGAARLDDEVFYGGSCSNNLYHHQYDREDDRSLFDWERRIRCPGFDGGGPTHHLPMSNGNQNTEIMSDKDQKLDLSLHL
ncbi:hypothetical protein OIU84_012097 [Salix udensis]|uniref:Uncharacterized protein n=1 Tax=Salix udensis TaxID=889485 RepID=A0AAD6JET3_9ROSI|nr:hypothetical protein OIU84_012097 [Salix udensis]